MLIVTFQDLDITAKDFNGINARRAEQAVINLAADRVNNRYHHPELAIESLYNWAGATVDWLLGRVEVPAVPFDEWCAINS